MYALRHAERQAGLFEQQVIPAATQIADNTREAYARGQMSFIELMDAQRTLLNVRLTAAEARAAREKSLADLEALIGVDVETLAPRPTTTQTTTRPTTEVSHERR